MYKKLESISRRLQQKVGFRTSEISFPIAYEPQFHEQNILNYFATEGRQFFSKPPKPVVEKNIVLCFTNRCGSNWLAALLNATGLIGHADEFFNAPRLIRTANDINAKSFTEAFHNQAIARNEQTENSFITKLSWDQLFFFAKMRIIPDMMPNTQFILMHRRNMAAQALSMRVAEQTGQWTSLWNSGKHGNRNPNAITNLEIQHSIDDITFKYQQFWRYFATFGVKPVEVYYEDIIVDPLTEVTRLVEALELNPEDKTWQLDESKVTLTKQADEASHKRVAEFLHNMQNHAPMSAETEPMEMV